MLQSKVQVSDVFNLKTFLLQNCHILKYHITFLSFQTIIPGTTQLVVTTFEISVAIFHQLFALKLSLAEFSLQNFPIQQKCSEFIFLGSKYPVHLKVVHVRGRCVAFSYEYFIRIAQLTVFFYINPTNEKQAVAKKFFKVLRNNSNMKTFNNKKKTKMKERGLNAET